jgi:hypothetical protein
MRPKRIERVFEYARGQERRSARWYVLPFSYCAAMVIVVSLLVLPHVEYDRSVIDLALTVLGGLIAWPYEVALSFVERMKLPHAKAIAACALLAIAILLDISLHSIRRKLRFK